MCTGQIRSSPPRDIQDPKPDNMLLTHILGRIMAIAQALFTTRTVEAGHRSRLTQRRSVGLRHGRHCGLLLLEGRDRSS